MRLTGWALTLAISLHAAAPGGDYADAKSCAACHRKIADSYRQTGMGRSMFPPAAANSVEDYQKQNQFLHQRSETHYAMLVRGGEYFQRRWQDGFDGRETNVEELKIDAVLGSGDHARSYLHRMPNGGYIELPLGWYAERGGYWAMSPGFDSTHPQTRRYVSYECVSCHDAIPKIPAGHNAPGSDPTFSAELPAGIDCQRCHGPGARHVAIAQRAGATVAEIRAAIVNPARLSTARQMDLCMQCHLEPTSTEFPSLIRRFNRGPFSYRPGEPLANFVLAFDHPAGAGYDDKFEIVNSSAYRLRKSQCFLKSQGALTCQTCHDPHVELRGEAATGHYSEVCRGCHQPQSLAASHPTAAECISCHMPKRRTEDVVHVVMTDHLIQRRPPARDLLADLTEPHPPEQMPYRGEVAPYDPPAPEAAYLAVAQVLMRNNLEKGVVELDQELRKNPQTEPEFYMILGQAWQDRRKSSEAVTAYEQALRLSPDSVRAMLALSQALAAANEPARTAELLQRAARLSPANPLVWFQAGAVDFAAGRAANATVKMQKALSLDPDIAGGHTGLAELLLRSGQIDGAEQQLRAALQLDPYDATACDLLGRVLAGKQQMAEALFDFRKAVRLRPGYAPHLYDLALALSSANQPEEARKAVEQALAANPEMPEAHALLGGLDAQQRDLPAAEREYREALRLKPDFARIHLDLARVLAAQGEMPQAIEQLRAAAAGPDPQVAQIAADALRRLAK